MSHNSAYDLEYYHRNRDRMRAARRASYHKNRAARIAQVVVYRQTEKGKAVARAASRDWHTNNPVASARNTATTLLARALGIGRREVPPELIEAKEQWLLAKRAIRSLRN